MSAVTSLVAKAQDAEPAAETAARHFLWRAEAPTSPGVIYLLGSLHVSRADMYPLPGTIMAAFEQADTVVFETDLAALGTPEFSSRLLLVSRYPPEQSLETNIAADTFARLRREAENNGLLLANLQHYRPWICANFLMMAALRRVGFNRTDGIDHYFLHQAREHGKRIENLETLDFQIQLFAGLSDDEAEDYLAQALDEVADVETFAPEFLRIWTQGDADALDAIISESFAHAPALYRKWFLERNLAWVENLRQRRGTDQCTFVVVGAGHLVGEKGVVNLLRQQGMTVRQL